MELRDTVDLMVSDDFRDRFKAEYYQLKIRYDKLQEIIKRVNEGTSNFNLSCPVDLYDMQLDYMYNYMKILESRASIEKIDL